MRSVGVSFKVLTNKAEIYTIFVLSGAVLSAILCHLVRSFLHSLFYGFRAGQEATGSLRSYLLHFTCASMGL
jgi:hypothetical protein